MNRRYNQILLVIIFEIFNYSCYMSEMPIPMLIDMHSVNSTKEFFDKFVLGGFKHFTHNNTVRFDENLGNCQPLEVILDVLPPSDPTLLTHPECIKVNRCIGCCGSKLLSCEPTEIIERNYRVSRLRYNRDNGMLQLIEDEILQVEDHVKCGCQCKVKPNNCTGEKIYEERVCECICKNRHERVKCIASEKIWDAKKCECTCKEQEECSTGYFFDPISCRCEHDDSVD